MHILAALEFPPVSHLLEWKEILFKGTPFAVNKVVLVIWASALITFLIFFLAGRRASLVPTGLQNLAESTIDFVREGIILQTMGPEGLSWAPFLTTMFCFIFFCNIFEIIPLVQFPANARMAVPAFLAILTWILFNYVGIKSQGGAYFKNVLLPPGVPGALLPLVALIEFVSTFFVRPFSLAVRLFANMLAGHLLLVTFAVLSAALFVANPLIVILPLPAVMLVLLTGFEVLVAVLQAFIFTILTAVYIGGAMHPEH